jgi:hypothetical protein
MNFCTKCQSIYAQPGTCNCYAPAQAAPQPYPGTTTVPFPSIPWTPPYSPWWGIYPPYSVPTVWGSLGNDTTITTTWKAGDPMTVVDMDGAVSQWSFTSGELT